MNLTQLRLTNFRNFEKAEFRFGTSHTVVCGPNARGKSNLLEAVYFLAVGKSGRGSRDRDVLRWGASFYRIEATIRKDDEELSLSLAYDPRVGKRAFVGEQPLDRLSRFIGAFNAVLFSPEDVDLVLRDPSQRRRLLDVLVSQSSASYLSDLEAYRRVLAQRNQLLRERPGQLAKDPAQLVPWDQQLAALGGRIVRRRFDALDRIQPTLQAAYDAIAPTSERLTATYRSQVAAGERSGAGELLLEALRERRVAEVEQGFTTIGPHREHLVFQLDEREAHRFASKGQLKSVLLSWKLAEAAFLEAETGHTPVLLMDDVFSELDRSRSDALLARLSGGKRQVLLTTARDPDLSFPDFGYHRIDL